MAHLPACYPRPLRHAIRYAALLAVLAVLAVLSGCDDLDDRPARWSYVYPAILQPACTTSGCHSKLTAAAGVDLSDLEGAHLILTGRVCGEPVPDEAPPRIFVTPGASTYSQLIYQLRGEDSAGRPYRDVMPPDLPLPDVEVALVARWIDDGALCD